MLMHRRPQVFQLVDAFATGAHDPNLRHGDKRDTGRARRVL